MSTNPRQHTDITIRLRPRQIKAVRAVLDAFVRNRHTNLPGMLGFGSEEIEVITDVLMHIPSIGNDKTAQP